MPARNARLTTQAVATIANGTALSGAVDIGDYASIVIQMPAAWTTASMTFAGCATEGGTYLPIYDDAGTEVTIASANVVASRMLVAKTFLGLLSGVKWLKIRSGVVATPVNQGQDTYITLILKS